MSYITEQSVLDTFINTFFPIVLEGAEITTAFDNLGNKYIFKSNKDNGTNRSVYTCICTNGDDEVLDIEIFFSTLDEFIIKFAEIQDIKQYGSALF